MADFVENNVCLDSMVNTEMVTVKVVKLFVPKSVPLVVKDPLLAAEWHPTKNIVSVAEVGSGSKDSVWWLGKCGREWLAAVNSRVAGRGCHYCSGFKVLVGFNDLATTHPDVANNWHPTKNENLFPTFVSANSHKKVWWFKNDCEHEFISSVANQVSTGGKNCAVCSGRQINFGFNDLATTHPELAKEWHPTLNKGILPAEVSAGSNKKVWWVCGKKHEWEMSCNTRTGKKPQNCPYCSGRRVLKGFNDMASLYPLLVDQWHPSANGALTAYDVTAKSGRKVWWQCEKGHEWEAPVYSRVNGNGCSYCANRVVSYAGLRGSELMLDKKPSLIVEWDSTKNAEVDVHNVPYGSKKNYWWKCYLGHEWLASPLSRTSVGSNCPFCSNKQVQVGFNDLVTVSPKLAAEWHPTKNGVHLAENFTRGSSFKAWWLGSKCKHVWQASITDRSIRGCPYCASAKLLVGFNDLVSKFPDVAGEWHPTRNGELTPSDVIAGSPTKVWWLCSKNHEWEATLGNRTRAGSGCPQCNADSFVSKGEKSVADYVASLGFAVRTSVRNLIKGELDIFVPEKNVAIEFNGLFWHSEANGKGKNYHYDKWKQCQDKGVQLIQVWEDEWNRNPVQVKQMLAHKLGVSSLRKVYARKLVPVVLEQGDVNVFLDVNHIQGAVEGSIRVGLMDSAGVVVAVMVLKREPGTEGKVLNLLRFATSVSVVGGFTKLLRYVGSVFGPESVVTFSDNCVSDGGLYESNGFVVAGVVRPDYKYIVRGVRVHKFGYRLKRFRDDPELLFEEGLTERELAGLNGLFRVWDAGKTKWVYTF